MSLCAILRLREPISFSPLLIYKIIKKQVKPPKSKRVLEASFDDIFEKFQISQSQNNMNFVEVAQIHMPEIFTSYA